ncbi:hypothetical protein D3C78_1592930 [compost metagenome]
MHHRQTVQQAQGLAARLLRVGRLGLAHRGVQVQRHQRIHLGIAQRDAFDMGVQQFAGAQMASQNLLPQRGGGLVAKFEYHG